MNVVLIDDDPVLSQQLRLLLSELSIDLEAIEDIDTAYEYLVKRNSRCNYIVCDLMMRPGRLFTQEETFGGIRTGVEFIKRIKNDRDVLRTIPIAAYSISSNKDIIRELLELGVTFYSKTKMLPRELVSQISMEIRC